MSGEGSDERDLKGCMVAACVVASSGLAQSKEPRFEVSAIRPSSLKGPFPVSGTPYLPRGRFHDPGTTLRVLIEMALWF